MVLEDVDDGDKLFCTITYLTGPEFADILMVQGVYDNMVITGGLGCFYGATGTVSGTGTDDGFNYTLAFDTEESVAALDCDLTVFDEPWLEEFGETFIDYLDDDESPGDGYMFDNKVITIGDKEAVLAGRCMFLQDLDNTYCNMVYTMQDGTGSIAVMGYYDGMAIIGGSGCYNSLLGTASGEEVDDGYAYTWALEEPGEAASS